MSFGFDSELPGGFQDADLEMRDLQSAAARESALKRQGICTHGWHGPVKVGEPARICFHCKEVFPNEVALDEARYDALN